MSFQSEVLVNASETLSFTELDAVELFKGYPDALLQFATVSCVIIMLIGIPGNIVTIIALAGYKKIRNATAIFIMNLSFSDLLFCFNIPLAASAFQHRAWIHGQVLCKISVYTRYTLFFNSYFTILAITINRYILIAHPKLYTKLYKTRNIILILLCSWMFSFGSIIIPIVFKNYSFCDRNNGFRSILKDRSNSSFKKILFLLAFILPCIAIALCYGRIFCIVRKATKKSSKTGKRDPDLEDSTSVDLLTSFSERIKPTNMTSRNTNTIKWSLKMEISDKIIELPEKIKKESPKLHRTTLKKSIKFLKVALPTRKESRLGIMIVAIMLSLFLCHLPITIITILKEKNLHPELDIVADILFFLSFCINPIIYVVMSKEYRRAYKNLFKRRKPLLYLSKKKIQPNVRSNSK